MVKTRRLLYGGVVNLLGLTFKGNFTGLYNSKVVDIIRELKEYGGPMERATRPASVGDKGTHEAKQKTELSPHLIAGPIEARKANAPTGAAFRGKPPCEARQC